MPTFVSAEGLKKMQEELDDRRNRIRKEITERISSAKELGDLSENFEYQEAKEAQGINETRIINLENMIKDSEIVKHTTGGTTIDLGTTFVVETGKLKKTFDMVGSNEADPMSGKISNESPLGLAFIGHGVGDTVDVEIPSGKITYKIVEIK